MKMFDVTDLSGTILFGADVDDVATTTRNCSGYKIHTRMGDDGILVGYEPPRGEPLFPNGRYILRLPNGCKFIRFGSLRAGTANTNIKNVIWDIVPDDDEHVRACAPDLIQAIVRQTKMAQPTTQPTTTLVVDLDDVVGNCAKYPNAKVYHNFGTVFSNPGILVGREQSGRYLLKVDRGHKADADDLQYWTMHGEFNRFTDHYICVAPGDIARFEMDVAGPAKPKAAKRVIPDYPHTCDCGSACIQLAMTCECTNSACRYFKRRA